MLELRNIEKYYNPGGTINEMCLFDKFNLTVDKGEFVSVVGSNGSGKTSMLNILCGSIPVDGGQILMNGGRYYNQERIQEKSEDWTCLSESGNGNMPDNDDS